MYKDRKTAGELLAEKIAERNFGNITLLAVPRGGIIVAAPVAEKLGTRLEVLVTRKIGHPSNPEVAIGAVMADGSAVLDDKLIKIVGISPKYIQQTIAAEFEELRRRMLLYTGSEKPPEVSGKTVIVVDDGIATGYTLRAAIRWLETLGAAKTIIAVPIAPWEATMELRSIVDELICPIQPTSFASVGAYYQNFSPTTDGEVLDALEKINYSLR
jgi:putative phosphoribosyl transferase